MVNSDYQVLLEPAALQDIQRVVDYYDERQTGLGERFVSAFEKHLIPIQKSPFFQVRYDYVRCLPIKKYPFMIHFTVDKESKTITVRAVFHTSLDPKKWTERKKNS